MENGGWEGWNRHATISALPASIFHRFPRSGSFPVPVPIPIPEITFQNDLQLDRQTELTCVVYAERRNSDHILCANFALLVGIPGNTPISRLNPPFQGGANDIQHVLHMEKMDHVLHMEKMDPS